MSRVVPTFSGDRITHLRSHRIYKRAAHTFLVRDRTLGSGFPEIEVMKRVGKVYYTSNSQYGMKDSWDKISIAQANSVKNVCIGISCRVRKRN